MIMLSKREIVKIIVTLAVGASVALTTVKLVGVDWSGRPESVPAPLYPTPQASPTGYVIPTGSPAPSLPPTEDSEGWDCRVQGDRVCMINGEHWLNVEYLPTSPWLRCVIGIGGVSWNIRVAQLSPMDICHQVEVSQ